MKLPRRSRCHLPQFDPESPAQSSWESTRSCPGSLRYARSRTISVHVHSTPGHSTDGITRSENSFHRLQRRNSYPSFSAMEVKPYCRRSSDNSPPEILCVSEDESIGSLATDSRWSLYKPSAHWDEVFEPGRELDISDSQQELTFKEVFANIRPRGLLSVALLFSAVYLAYAFYVTVTRVRMCKGSTSNSNNNILSPPTFTKPNS